jgi:hypothetical protein
MFGPPKKTLFHWKQYSHYSVAKTGTSLVNKKKNGKELNQYVKPPETETQEGLQHGLQLI